MKTHLKKRHAQDAKLYKKIVGTLGITRAESMYGHKAVKWALNRYLKGSAERARLLKEKAEAERRLAEISKQL